MINKIKRRIAPVLLAVLTLAAAFGIQTVTAPQASAAPTQRAWIATAYGTVQILQDVNHWWGEYYNSYGQLVFRAFDVWLPWFCSGVFWQGGDFYNHTPAQISFYNPGLGGYHTGENGLRGCWVNIPQSSTDGFGQIKVTPQGCHLSGNCASSYVSTAGSMFYNPNNVYRYNDCTYLGGPPTGDCTLGSDHRGVLVIS